MSNETESKKKWPYLWYDPQTGVPFDVKMNTHPPKTPPGTRTTKLREEMISRDSQALSEPFPRHILTAPTQFFMGSTKTQKLREMLATKILEEHQRRESLDKKVFRARTLPASTGDEMQLQTHKTTNSQRLREQFSRRDAKPDQRRNSGSMAAFMEDHKRILSSSSWDMVPKIERKRTESNIRDVNLRKSVVASSTEKKSKINPRRLEGAANLKTNTDSSKVQNYKTPPFAHKPTDTNLARARHSSETKIYQKGKPLNNQASIRKQDSISTSTSGRKSRAQPSGSVNKVNTAISKNRVNFLKEKMKRMSINEGCDAKMPALSQHFLTLVNQPKTASEEPKNSSRDKNVKTIMPPINKRIDNVYSPTVNKRDIFQDTLSSTDEDSSESES